MNLIDMVDEPFFNLVMQLLGSASDAYDNVVEVPHKKKTLLKIYQATSPFFSSKDSADTQEASKQKPDQVEDIEPSTTRTPSNRKLL